MTTTATLPFDSPVTDVKLQSDCAGFMWNSQRWIFEATRGRLYTGALGSVIYQSRNGSFDFDGATMRDVLGYAKLFGAFVWRVK